MHDAVIVSAVRTAVGKAPHNAGSIAYIDETAVRKIRSERLTARVLRIRKTILGRFHPRIPCIHPLL